MALKIRDYDSLIEEIERLKLQADELRDALEERVFQSQRLQRMLGDRDTDYSDVIRYLKASAMQIQDVIVDSKKEVCNSIDRMDTDFYQALVDQNKLLEATCTEIDKRLKELQRELAVLAEGHENLHGSLEELAEDLKEKATEKRVASLERKNRLLCGIAFAGGIGVLVCVILLCVLIYMVAH